MKFRVMLCKTNRAEVKHQNAKRIYVWCVFLSLCSVYILVHSHLFSLPLSLSLSFSFSLGVTLRSVCNISGKYFSNSQTLVSICSVFLAVLQALIWQHAVLIWLSPHTTTKAPNTWALVSWTTKTKFNKTNCDAQGTVGDMNKSLILKMPRKRRTGEAQTPKRFALLLILKKKKFLDFLLCKTLSFGLLKFLLFF